MCHAGGWTFPGPVRFLEEGIPCPPKPPGPTSYRRPIPSPAGASASSAWHLSSPRSRPCPEPSGSDQTYTYGDIQPLRDRWWGLLLLLSAGLVLNVPAQALLTTFIVRRRGAALATVGGA